MGKLIIPPLISMCIILTIICTEVIAGGQHTKDETKLSTIDAIDENEQYEGINQYEKTIINRISYGLNIVGDNSTRKDEIEYTIYIQYLKEYLGTSEVDIEKAQADQMVDKILDLTNIMTLEQNNCFHKMSLDGREMSIQLAKEIYSLCGLEITFDLQGNIVQISDDLDSIIYQNKASNQQAKFQINIFLIILLIIMLMFGNCVLIAKKTKLFIKGGGYDGFKKNRFA